MASFTVQSLAGDRALVKGTDVNGVTDQTVVDAGEWNMFKQHDKHLAAHEAFDETVREFFKPITDAAKTVSELDKNKDPLYYEVLSEEVEAVEGKDEVRFDLSYGSIILKAIEMDEVHRLIWVNGKLEVLDLQ